jgi:DNA repair protein RecN (Recombination protein N)
VLVELVVENYAVIEKLRVRFHAGLNLLTGETGSGKSIVVDAFGLLLGGRASADLIRTGAVRARVAGIFEVPDNGPAREFLKAVDIELEDGELLIEREILAEGKSRAFAGGRPVTAALLRDLGRHLGDIHGQHDQQRLFEPGAQLEFLDSFAGAEAILQETGLRYAEWRSCREEMDELERGEQERLRMADLWSFQRREIEEAAPKVGEDAELEAERRRLQNFARIEEAARSAYAALYDSSDSAVARIRSSLRRLEELARIDPSLGSLAESLRPSEFAVEEASFALRDYISHLEANPERLEEIESRLSALDKLKRKYGSTLEEVVAYLEEVRERVATVESAEERRLALARKLAELAAGYEEAAGRLSRLRKDAASKLAKRVQEELGALAMQQTSFLVRLEQGGWSAEGTETARFLVSANPGEEPRPLEKVASGGEISRIALALRTCVAAAPGKVRSVGPPRTLVFDEVDAGVGGRAAEAVGRRLRLSASANQVLCVTHLPQIAGFADHHYYVEKREANGRTVAVIGELEGAARTREIGRMLSGEKVTEEALRHAEKLVQMCSR